MLVHFILGFDGEEISMVCPMACTYLHVSYEYPSIYNLKDGYTPSITFYFETSVTARESHLKYDSKSLFAEIGGYTGLLLGVSLLDVQKIFKFLCEKLCTYYSNQNEIDPYEIV